MTRNAHMLRCCDCAVAPAGDGGGARRKVQDRRRDRRRDPGEGKEGHTAGAHRRAAARCAAASDAVEAGTVALSTSAVHSRSAGVEAGARRVHVHRQGAGDGRPATQNPVRAPTTTAARSSASHAPHPRPHTRQPLTPHLARARAWPRRASLTSLGDTRTGWLRLVPRSFTDYEERVVTKTVEVPVERKVLKEGYRTDEVWALHIAPSRQRTRTLAARPGHPVLAAQPITRAATLFHHTQLSSLSLSLSLLSSSVLSSSLFPAHRCFAAHARSRVACDLLRSLLLWLAGPTRDTGYLLCGTHPRRWLAWRTP
jgi:hypothetical protein